MYIYVYSYILHCAFYCRRASGNARAPRSDRFAKIFFSTLAQRERARSARVLPLNVSWKIWHFDRLTQYSPIHPSELYIRRAFFFSRELVRTRQLCGAHVSVSVPQNLIRRSVYYYRMTYRFSMDSHDSGLFGFWCLVLPRWKCRSTVVKASKIILVRNLFSL